MNLIFWLGFLALDVRIEHTFSNYKKNRRFTDGLRPMQNFAKRFGSAVINPPAP
jgi:hypothetical protein